jgi:hypothetical protein
LSSQSPSQRGAHGHANWTAAEGEVVGAAAAIAWPGAEYASTFPFPFLWKKTASLEMQDICVTAAAYGRPRRAVKAWKSVASIKCKIFVWLAHKHRMSTNARKHRHQLATLAICPEVEDVDHLLVGCCKAREVWDSFSYSDGARGIDDLLDS